MATKRLLQPSPLSLPPPLPPTPLLIKRNSAPISPISLLHPDSLRYSTSTEAIPGRVPALGVERDPAMGVQRENTLDPFVFDDYDDEGPPMYEESLGALEGFQIAEVDARNGDGAARFGRWQEWVEKRAAERYADMPREDRRIHDTSAASTQRPPSYDASVVEVLSTAQRNRSSHRLPHSPPPPRGTEYESLGLMREDFGPNTLPHSAHRITSALPLISGALILLGTVDGLSVLSEGATRPVWTGLPVWDIRVLRASEGDERTPKGSVLLLCGGVEDPGNPGRPKPKDQEVEARIWKLGSLASLGMWTARQDSSWEGFEILPQRNKGKGKAKTASKPLGDPFQASGGSQPRLPAPNTSTDPVPSPREVELVLAWAADFVSLQASTTSKSADIISVATRTIEPEIFVALATPSHILLHIGQSSASGFSFRAARTFYLPLQPARIGLLELSQEPSRRNGDRYMRSLEAGTGRTRSGNVLGIWVSFGEKACVIRTSDSAVLDFKPPSGRGVGKGGGEWGEMQSVKLGEQELFLFTRGSETLVYPSPLRIPISTPPVVHTTWPEIPNSVLASAAPHGITLLATNPSGELCVQHAVYADGALCLLPHNAVILGQSRIMPMSWSALSGVYVALSSRKGEHGWRLCRLDPM